jgi:hypothetical protein
MAQSFRNVRCIVERPDFIEQGELARLIPVVSDGSKESRATSILLATMMAVPALAASLLAPLGVRVGARSVVGAFCEVVLRPGKDGPTDCRPDGLLVLTSGRNRAWSCVVESKIGRAELEPEQVAKYVSLARTSGIDAVLTISNQFAALPTHSPVRLKRALPKNVALFHWSWLHVLTEAMLLLNDEELDQAEQRFILSEMVRYFSHASIGVSMFDRMNPEWKQLVGSVQAGALIAKSTDVVQKSVAAWHQETRDLALLMTRNLNSSVRLRLSRAHINDPQARLRDDSERLARDHKLVCELWIPDAAAPLVVTADLRRRTVEVSMTLDAPKDRKRSTSRINWIVRQLAKVTIADVHVRAAWPGRAPMTQAPLASVQSDANVLEADNRKLAPTTFEVALVRDLGGKFGGTKNFVESVEEAVTTFYEAIGQHLRAYVAPPPRVRRAEVKDDDSADAIRDAAEETASAVATELGAE